MEIFKHSDLDVVYWDDVDEYIKLNPTVNRFLVWHGDSIAQYTRTSRKYEDIPFGMRLGQYDGKGDFHFYDSKGILHTVFKNSRFWRVWKEMDEFRKTHKSK